METSNQTVDADSHKIADDETGDSRETIPAESQETGASKMHRRMSRKGKQSIVFSVPDLPPVRRPRGLEQANRPSEIPMPDHKHLPGWTKRMHQQAEPILADIGGLLADEPRKEFLDRVSKVVALISQGKFSQARLYPVIIEDGFKEVQKERKTQEKSYRQTMALSSYRKKLSEDLRTLQGRIPSEQLGQLHHALKAASTREDLTAVQTEVDKHLGDAQSVEQRRREREINRTREKIMHLDGGTKSKPNAPVIEPDEGWQAMLKKFALDNGIVNQDKTPVTDERS